MRAPEPVEAFRIVATPAVLDSVAWPEGTTAARVAPDEVLLLDGPPPEIPDVHALIAEDRGFSAVYLSSDDLDEVANRCAWAFAKRPAVAQGAVLGIPIRIVFPPDPAGDPILLVSTTLAAALREEFR